MRAHPAPYLGAILIGLLPCLVSGVAGAQDGPPQPGQCFGRIERPTAFAHEARRVLVRPGRWEERGRPPAYAVETRRALLRPARVERFAEPALYRTERHWTVTPGADRWVRTPARFEIERREVLIAPAHAEWRPAAPRFAYADAQPGQTVVQPTGEVLCRVLCPARYGVVERRVMTARGGWVRLRGRPLYHAHEQRVLVRPAHLFERRIAAAYRYERITHLVRPGWRLRVFVRPAYGTVYAQRPVSGGPGWSRVYCAGPLSPPFVARLQGALASRGYDSGPADGMDRPQTHDALHRWQRDHGLASGQVTVESAQALGIAP